MGGNLRFGTRTDLQKAPDHRTDPATHCVLWRPSLGRERQYRTPPVASRPLSLPLGVVSREEWVGQLASCYLRSRPATVPCISSECPRYDTSRTAWKHLCRRLAGGLVEVVSHDISRLQRAGYFSCHLCPVSYYSIPALKHED